MAENCTSAGNVIAKIILVSAVLLWIFLSVNFLKCFIISNGSIVSLQLLYLSYYS